MDDYKKYEMQCEQIRKENEKVLQGFALWLKEKDLTDDTIKSHVTNVDFYINEFLLYEEANEAKDGHSAISEFLGYWFIRKATWSSVTNIKANAASLKKFYTFMCETGSVAQEDYKDLTETIKDGMPEWLETMKRYENPDIEDMNEVWEM